MQNGLIHLHNFTDPLAAAHYLACEARAAGLCPMSAVMVVTGTAMSDDILNWHDALVAIYSDLLTGSTFKGAA